MLAAEETKIPPGCHTLEGKLQSLKGRPIILYLKCVCVDHFVLWPCPPGHGHHSPGYPPGASGPVSSSPGAGQGFGGPPLTPGEPPGGGHVVPIEALKSGGGQGLPCSSGTQFLTGVLISVGCDYLVLRVTAGIFCGEFIVPYSAVGMIVPCGTSK